jgi:hypothetical protein
LQFFISEFITRVKTKMFQKKTKNGGLYSEVKQEVEKAWEALPNHASHLLLP